MFYFAILVIFLYIIYKNFVVPTFYWKSRGVFCVNPYSRVFRVFFGKKSFVEIVREAYEEFPNKRYYGSYQFLRPSLLVRDLELARKITVKDFEHFHDHSTVSNDTVDPVVNQNLFALRGQKWRDMRSTLSPAFTSSKMKLMFALIAKSADNFSRYFLENPQVDEIEMKDFYSKYTNDVIASCAFGIDCDSLKNSENEFFRMGKFFSGAFSGRRALRGLINAFFPAVARTLRIAIFPHFVTEFFKRIVRDTISYRDKEGVIRPDLIHLLMQARKGQLQQDGVDAETAGFATVHEATTAKNYVNDKMELTDDLITAQVLVFFFAGFDTSSTLLSFLSYELALNEDIQKRLQMEVDETLRKTIGTLEYDAVLKMTYLDQVVSEALRMYPPGFAISRVCTKNYEIPAKYPDEKHLVLEKGCLVAIPVCGIHMNPKYFPKPEKFDPDRFSDENRSNIIPGSYMPFGSGPRNCIGSRFALLETKALIVSLLSKFTFVATGKTEVPITFARTAILAPKNGIWLRLEPRK